jgi:hypothetical protein
MCSTPPQLCGWRCNTRHQNPDSKRADDTERAGCKPDPGAAPVGANATPTVAARQNTTMAELAQNVQQWAGGYIDHPAKEAVKSWRSRAVPPACWRLRRPGAHF